MTRRPSLLTLAISRGAMAGVRINHIGAGHWWEAEALETSDLRLVVCSSRYRRSAEAGLRAALESLPVRAS